MSRGFTLLEILLAIVILGTVLSTVFVSYSKTYQIINDVETQLDVYAMARTTLDRITEDLGSLHISEQSFTANPDDPKPLWHLFEGSDNTVGGESADTLVFTSRAHIGFGPEDETGMMGIIAYTTEEREDGGPLVLLRGDRLLLEKKPEEQLEELPKGFSVCEGLASVEFKYYDEDGVEEESWSFAKERDVPWRVSITLAFVNPVAEDSRYIFSTSVAIPVRKPIFESEE